MELHNTFDKYQNKIIHTNYRYIDWYNHNVKYIKKTKILKFQTIDDPALTDSYISDRYAQHLNYAQGSPFTVEPLRTLISEYIFITFSQALLNGTTDLEKIKVSPTVKLYLHQLKRKKILLVKINKVEYPLTTLKRI